MLHAPSVESGMATVAPSATVVAVPSLRLHPSSSHSCTAYPRCLLLGVHPLSRSHHHGLLRPCRRSTFYGSRTARSELSSHPSSNDARLRAQWRPQAKALAQGGNHLAAGVPSPPTPTMIPSPSRRLLTRPTSAVRQGSGGRRQHATPSPANLAWRSERYRPTK